MSVAPIFVDDSGRRRVLTRRVGRIFVIGFTAYLGLLVIGFARDPRVGPIHLPTFGLPSLGLLAPPAPSVLGEQDERTAASAPATEVPGRGADERPSGSTTPGTNRPNPAVTVAGGGSAPAGTNPVLDLTGGPAAPSPGAVVEPGPLPTPPTTARPGNGPKPSTTTSTSTSTSTSSTTTTTTTTSTTGPAQGSAQGDGQGSGQGPVSAKGPDGTGAPGQERKPTTTTAG